MRSLETSLLFRSRLVSLSVVSCQAEGDHGEIECNESDDVVFPRRGAFTVTRARGSITVADANSVVYLNRGDEYRVEHNVGRGDESLVVSAAPRLLDEIKSTAAGTSSGAPSGHGVFPRTHGLVDPRVDYLLRRLTDALQAGTPVSGLLVESVAARAVGLAFEPPRDGGEARSARGRTRQLRVVAGAQELLNARYADNVSLATIAAELAVSPYHLSRIFHRVTGVPMHRYQLSLRLRHAVDRLIDGEPRITPLAHELGFADHSHLTNTIRREIGLAPSAVRRPVSGRELAGLARLAFPATPPGQPPA